MARFSKKQLLGCIVHALASSGSDFHVIATTHPFRIVLATPEDPQIVRIYIWNLTHGGGGARPADEHRIQITGITKRSLDPELDGSTVILGWWDNMGVFAAFDYSKHARPLGKSPSIQIRQQTLVEANEIGLAVAEKGNREVAFGVRPDMLWTYLTRSSQLHDFGVSHRDVATLQVVATSDFRTGTEGKLEVTAKRRKVLVQVARTAREASFRSRVLNAYTHRCAFCRVQLRLLDAAHIVPVATSGSTDETRNGLCLCTLHHRAYDQGLVHVGEDYRISINELAVDRLRAERQAGGLKRFASNLRPALHLPVDRRDYPAPSYLKMGQEIRQASIA